LERPAAPVSPAATPPGAPPTAPRNGAGRAAWANPRNLIIAGLALVAIFFALRRGPAAPSTPEASGPRGNRLAVLPFRGQQGALEEFLVNGLVEDIRAKLNGVSALTVIGSASVEEYRNSSKSPADIGRELTADFLLTGDIRTAGDGSARQVMIEPKLLDARSGKVLWEKPSSAAEGELPSLPTEVATGVIDALGVTPKAGEKEELSERPTSNAEAYRSLLRGRQIVFSSGSDPATLRAAVQELEQAVALDSAFVEAWARLASANTNLYGNGTPDPRVAARAKEAMERAVALSPDRAMVRRVRAGYLLSVAGDEAAGGTEIDRALRAAPNDVALLASSGSQDMNRGDLGSALTKFERARQLDPRAAGNLANLVQAYTFLGRAADAKAAGATLVAVRPRDLTSRQWVTIAHLADGDIEGARAVLRDAVQRGLPALRLAVQMAGYFEMAWALEESQQQLVLRLNPTAFDNDRAWWAQSLATLHWQRGDTVRARAYADSAIAPTRQQLAGAPNDPQLHGLLALMQAYTGRAADARQEEKLSLVHVNRYSQQAYHLVNAAKTELALGDKDAALSLLAKARERGYYVTNALLRVDPSYASLKGYPPFEKMVQGQ
jgi:TolB-like protein/tetratricopeptide (TPR) repeat protein